MPLDSPNMHMPVPVVEVDDGPAWAQLIDACLAIIDSHNHTPGAGVPVPPSGLDMSADLTMKGNDLTDLRSARFDSQAGQLVLATDVGSIYVLAGDLWFISGAGEQVQITQGGSIVGAPGTITGLPAGTASASYLTGTFTFEGAAGTPAAMQVGPLIIGRQAVGSKTVTLSPAALQANSYALTLPAVAPVADESLRSDGSGNLSWVNDQAGRVPLGGIIFIGRATTFSIPSRVGPGSTGSVVDGWMRCDGCTIPAGQALSGTTPVLDDSRFIMGSTTNAGAGGANTKNLTHVHPMSHVHMFAQGGTSFVYARQAIDTTSTTIPTSGAVFSGHHSGDTGSTFYNISADGGTLSYYTTGSLDSGGSLVSNTGGGGSASQDITPAYLAGIALIRVN